MPNRRHFKSPALRYAYERYVSKGASGAAAFEKELAGAKIAGEIYKLRLKRRRAFESRQGFRA